MLLACVTNFGSNPLSNVAASRRCLNMNFDELERASFHHAIYDADQTDINPLWYRESLNTGYEFRLAPRDPEKPQPSCRIDQDLSGDYDPSVKRARQILPIKRKREPQPLPADGSREPAHRKPRLMTWQNVDSMG